MACHNLDHLLGFVVNPKVLEAKCLFGRIGQALALLALLGQLGARPNAALHYPRSHMPSVIDWSLDERAQIMFLNDLRC